MSPADIDNMTRSDKRQIAIINALVIISLFGLVGAIIRCVHMAIQ